jgi:hypothetical protein
VLLQKAYTPGRSRNSPEENPVTNSKNFQQNLADPWANPVIESRYTLIVNLATKTPAVADGR